MSEFCLLADPTNYHPHNCDLVADPKARKYWLDLFEGHFKVTLNHASEQYGRTAANRIAESGEQFAGRFVKTRIS